MKAFVAKVIKF